MIKNSHKALLMILMSLVAGSLWAQTSHTLTVPMVEPGSITIDGQLDEWFWQKETSGTLTFGVGGEAAGFDNELSYVIVGDAQYVTTEPMQIIKMLHDGEGKLYVAMTAYDTDIQGKDGSTTYWWDYQDSDGLGYIGVLNKGLTTFSGETMTFFPPAANPEETGIQVSGEFFGAADEGTSWAWSFLPGANTVNNITDTDTGFIIEFVIDLTVAGYDITDTDIQMGIMTANHNGPITDGYPWGSSANARFQWSVGNYSVDYCINHLNLVSTPAVPVELSDFISE